MDRFLDDRQNGQVLAQRFRELGYDIPEAHIIQVGAVISTHIGPNAIGFVYVTQESQKKLVVKNECL